ncbi:gp53-like domain-containing protein [Vibrio penaeicida]|uniref:gp53-like domain-containing protein n=1 Tax=Vibrio penaeicida TaxID=104609 RepID=UPI000CE9E13D|nr:hypothetical protein [Vibrio penaeicida]
MALDGAVDRFELKNNAATDSDIDQKAVFSKFVRLPQFWRAFRAFLSQRFDGASTDLAVSEKALSAGLDTKWTFTLAKTNRYGATVLSHDYDSDIQYKAVTPFALKSGLDWVRYTTGLALDGKQDKGVVVAHDHDERYLPKQGPAVAVAQNTDTSWKPADGGLRCNSTSAGTFAPNADYCDYLTWGHRGGANYYHALFVSHASPSRLQFATSRAAGQANWSTKSLAFTDEFYGRQTSDNRYLSKAEKASDAQRLDGIDATGFGRAYSASLTTGAGDWTTAQFVTYLQGQGCFDSPYWFTKCSWSYANNKRITDLGSALGHIHLAGCVIEVLGSAAHYMIRVTTPSTTTGGAVANADYLYVDHGSGYAPGWRRGYNSRIKPTAAEVGALGKTETAKNAEKLDGALLVTTPASNTAARRDSRGDITARLFRATYRDDAYMRGALAFRVNDGTDNYTRFCNSPSAVRSWLSTASIEQANAQYKIGKEVCFKDITVGGDANTYYPVLLNGAAVFGFHNYSVSRDSDWPAPNTWNNATHRGRLTLTWLWSGYATWENYYPPFRIQEFSEMYSSMVAGIRWSVEGMVVWLRGGGARYRLHTEKGILQEAQVYLNGFTAHNDEMFSPRTDNSNLNFELFLRWPVRKEGQLYDFGHRVFSPNNRNVSSDYNNRSDSVYASINAVRKLKDYVIGGVSVSKGTNGYLRLPGWLGGLILQWGRGSASGASSTEGTANTLPIACPNALVFATAIHVGTQSSMTNMIITRTEKHRVWIKSNYQSNISAMYLCVGY